MRLISAAAAIAVSASPNPVGAGMPAREPARIGRLMPEPARSRLPREHVIESILRTSQGATADFLAGFGDEALRHYLERLDAKEKPRGRDAFWIRRQETAAFNAFEQVD